MSERTVSESAVVDAPPEVVFELLADPRQHEVIDGSGSVKGNVRGPERLSKGASFGVDMRMFGLPYKIRNRVVEFDEGRRIAWRHFGGHRWRYELEPLEGGRTRVTETFDYSMYTPAKARVIEVAGFPARNRRGIQGTLRRLADAVRDRAA